MPFNEDHILIKKLYQFKGYTVYKLPTELVELERAMSLESPKKT